MDKILELIGDDRLDEAIEELTVLCAEIEDILKNLIILKSRLTNIYRDSIKDTLDQATQDQRKNKVKDALIEITFQLKHRIKSAEKNTILKKEQKEIAKLPYPEFNRSFRDVVAPYYIPSSKSYLHLVFGDISKIEHLNLVVGCSQNFDMHQSSPRSALGSLWNVSVNGHPLLIEIDKLWEPKMRPVAAGLGTTEYVQLPANSNSLEGVLFTVTTRDASTREIDYGMYANTPVEGIPIVLSQVFEKVRESGLSSIVIPLLGAGFANIARTNGNPELRSVIEKVILAITIDESLNELIGENEYLKRIIIVIYSDQPQSKREHELWELTIKMLTPNTEKRLKMIDEMIAAIE
ncbi:MAG: hypothetical protein R2824_27040 [Saprospiraceae bacterium]